MRAAEDAPFGRVSPERRGRSPPRREIRAAFRKRKRGQPIPARD